jgi:hypothetical protein
MSEGPTAEKLSCHGCKHYQQVRYQCQGDSGYDKSCGYFSPAKEMDEYSGTPEWCPFRSRRADLLAKDREALVNAIDVISDSDITEWDLDLPRRERALSVLDRLLGGEGGM